MENSIVGISKIKELKYIYTWLHKNGKLDQIYSDLGIYNKRNINDLVKLYNSGNYKRISEFRKDYPSEYSWIIYKKKYIEFKKIINYKIYKRNINDLVKLYNSKNYKNISEFRKLYHPDYDWIIRSKLMNEFKEKINYKTKKI